VVEWPVPPRRPSPVGTHLQTSGALAGDGLPYAAKVGAEAVQVFASNPRAWAVPAADPDGDAEFGGACAEARMPVFVHASYLVNLASPAPLTRQHSLESVRHAMARGRRLGARGVVLHAGSHGGAGQRAGLALLRAALPALLGELDGDDPDLLIEPTAGGGHPMAATVEELTAVLEVTGGHPKVGFCLDTCHAFAAGHDLTRPGGTRQLLGAVVKAAGRGRLRLVHANDSRDPVGSRRDRHANIGTGKIGLDPFAELFRHPATSGVPVIVETPGDADAHLRDISVLKQLRDR
jgi:deoxyribonuclease-4